MTSWDWLVMFRGDPFFERLVKERKVVREYTGPFGRGISKRPLSLAASIFRSGNTVAQMNMYMETAYGIRAYGAAAKGITDALVYWFAENWDRWMEES